VVPGGTLRQDSVLNGLAGLAEDVRYVSVHDGARPCVTPETISETIRTARRCESGVAAVAITDTVKEVQKGTTVSRTLDRSKLWAVQTPQSFRRDLLEEALRFVRKKRVRVTDEASAVELLGKDVYLVPSSWTNIKITTADDLPVAACLLRL
jgi:2-C-methyl-D-erythritol 4-phosphate cytidylyltransferase